MENKVTCDTKTKDDVFVSVEVAIQFQVIPDSAFDAIYKLTDISTQVDSFVKDVIRGLLPTMYIDGVFEAKDEVAQAVKARLTEAMSSFGYIIINTLVTDITPDGMIVKAMNRMETEKRLKTASETRALTQKTITIRGAEASAEAQFLQGQGMAKQRGAIVDGLKQALAGGSRGDQGVPVEQVRELLLVTSYFDTMKALSQGQASTVFVSGTESTTTNEEHIRNGYMQGMAADIRTKR